MFGRILGIAHVVDGEIYQAGVRAGKRGELARDLFFGGVEKKRIGDRGGGVEMIMMVGLLNFLMKGISQPMKLDLVLLAVGITLVKAIVRI